MPCVVCDHMGCGPGSSQNHSYDVDCLCFPGFNLGTKVQASIDGKLFTGTVTVSDTNYTQFVDQTDDTRTVIVRNREDKVQLAQ